MKLNDYQKKAMSTRMESCNNYEYMLQGLVSEVGEFAGKAAKVIRRCEAYTIANQLCVKDRPNEFNPLSKVRDGNKIKEPMADELGDILWFVAGLADNLGYSLSDIAERNLAKLQARKAAGTIDGNGDGVSKEERL